MYREDCLFVIREVMWCPRSLSVSLVKKAVCQCASDFKLTQYILTPELKSVIVAGVKMGVFIWFNGDLNAYFYFCF